MSAQVMSVPGGGEANSGQKGDTRSLGAAIILGEVAVAARCSGASLPQCPIPESCQGLGECHLKLKSSSVPGREEGPT